MLDSISVSFVESGLSRLLEIMQAEGAEPELLSLAQSVGDDLVQLLRGDWPSFEPCKICGGVVNWARSSTLDVCRDCFWPPATISQYAAAHQRPVSTVRRWCSSGHLPGVVRFGGRGIWLLPQALVHSPAGGDHVS